MEEIILTTALIGLVATNTGNPKVANVATTVLKYELIMQLIGFIFFIIFVIVMGIFFLIIWTKNFQPPNFSHVSASSPEETLIKKVQNSNSSLQYSKI